MRDETSTLSKLVPGWRTALSAILIAAALPPWDLHFLIWIALVPWLIETSRTPGYASALVQGFWLSFSVALLSAYWLAFAVHDFLSVGWLPSSLALLLYAALGAQPQFVAFAALVRLATRSLEEGQRFSAGLRTGLGVGLSLAMALCYAGLDWALPRLFDVGLGYALHSASNLRQLAEIGGVSLLSFLIVWVNVLAWRILATASQAIQDSRERLVHAALIAALLGSTFVYGALRNRDLELPAESPAKLVRVGVAQGNVPNEVRLAWASGDDRAAEKQLSTYMLLTEQFIKETPRPDLVVWPEATFPGVFLQPASKLQEGRGIKFDRQVMRLNTPIVFGAYDRKEVSGTPTLFNTLFAIVPDYARPGSQGAVQRYHKHDLLPFAETLPGAGDVAWIRDALPTLGFFGRGEGARVFVLTLPDGSNVRAAPFICSESLNPDTIIASAKRNSQMLLNVGSDGWFGSFAEPEFHLAISKFRSIETRLPQVRAANTGITALILPSGEIAARTKSDEATTRILEVPLAEPVAAGERTKMLEWGDWFGFRALEVGAPLLLILVWASRRSLP